MNHVVWYTFIFIVLSLFAFSLVFRALTNKNIVDAPKIYNQIVDSNKPLTINQCLEKEKINGLDTATDPHLQKLFEYQEVCGSFVTDRLMIFTDMPKDKNDSEAKAKAIAATLREFDKVGVIPIVIVEPVSEWGLIDFQEFGTGFYDEWIDDYFDTLKKEGITDKQMGIWVPFPEANLPYWNHGNASPEDFSLVVNKYLGTMKKYFPEAKGSVLLNSATYETDDFNWENGEYNSLVPYVSKIDKNLVDSFGIQGFSWMPPLDSSRSVGIFDAREYLNSRLAMEAADTLGVKEIWFNTGSFSAKYTLDEELTVTLTPSKRKDVLNGILSEVGVAKEKGYVVWINLFSEDKSQNTEATNWSYWKNHLDSSEPHRTVFSDFIIKANELNIPVALFDKKH